MYEQLVVSVEVGLYHVYLLLYLLFYLRDLVSVAPARDGVFMNAVNA